MNKSWKISQHAHKIIADLNARNINIRVLTLCGGILIIMLLWYLIFWIPVSSEKNSIVDQSNIQKQQLIGMAQEVQKLVLGDSVDTGFYQQKIQLQQRLAQLDSQFDVQAVKLIPASKMDDVLRELLASVANLQLLTLNNVPPQTVGVGAISGVKSIIYQYGVQMTFSGNYFATLEYLQQIEALPSSFFWESLNYQVSLYPNATVVLQVDTLGRTQQVSS